MTCRNCNQYTVGKSNYCNLCREQQKIKRFQVTVVEDRCETVYGYVIIEAKTEEEAEEFALGIEFDRIKWGNVEEYEYHSHEVTYIEEL